MFRQPCTRKDDENFKNNTKKTFFAVQSIVPMILICNDERKVINDVTMSKSMLIDELKLFASEQKTIKI